ncbi:MAG: PAS domain-containing sensor histidine kinase [Candidatus Methanospirareceae archaeon]
MAWPHSHEVSARISLEDKQFKTMGFKETEAIQTSDIMVGGTRYGIIEICYPRELSKTYNSLCFIELGRFLNTFANFLGGIIEHKLAYQTLVNRVEFFDKVLNRASYPIVVINPDDSVQYVNRSFEKMTGFDSSDVCGKKPPYPWWPDDSLRELCDIFRQARTKGGSSLQLRFKRKHGRYFWVHLADSTLKIRGQPKYYLSNWIDITNEKRLKENTLFYIREITISQENERKRIARELHDTALQNLLGLFPNVDLIINKTPPSSEIASIIADVRTNISKIIDETRHYAHELRSELLDNLGLMPALRNLIEEAEVKSDLKCRIEQTGPMVRLSAETELALFRICQEAVRNIVRHAEALNATIEVVFVIRGGMKLTIHDDGKGFRMPSGISEFARMGKLGILGMQERTCMIGGTLSIVSKPNKGTRLTVRVPNDHNDRDLCTLSGLGRGKSV